MPRRPSPHPRPLRAWSTLVVLLCLLPSAAAQTSSVGVLAGQAGPSLVARVASVRADPGTVDAWARVGPEAGFGVVWRYAQVFGPIGNLIVEGGTDLLVPTGAATAGFRAALGARGVAGPLAAHLRVDAGTVAEDELDGWLRAEATRGAAGLQRGDPDVGARLGATYRIDRATTAAVESRGRWAAGSMAGWAAGSLRRSGAPGELDAWLGVEAGAFAGRAAAAVGVGTVLTRRREPDSWLRVWLGSDGVNLLPGVEMLLASRSPGSTLAIGAEWVPHRLDARAWRATLEASDTSLAPADGTWRLRAAVAGGAGDSTGHGDRPLAFSLSLALERPWIATP